MAWSQPIEAGAKILRRGGLHATVSVIVMEGVHVHRHQPRRLQARCFRNRVGWDRSNRDQPERQSLV